MKIFNLFGILIVFVTFFSSCEKEDDIINPTPPVTTKTIFGNEIIATTQFTIDNGNWQVAKHPRKMADVNGDGRADIIGFGANIVMVALGKSDGGFESLKTAYDYFTYNNGGMRTEKHVREVADVNGDGRADIVAFGEKFVFVALGQTDGTFKQHQSTIKSFAYHPDSGNWNVEKHTRKVADVNGDGKVDIIGFHQNNVYVALGQADGTFGSTIVAYDNFTYNKGWNPNKYVQEVGDVNGDGKADIVAFGNEGVFVAFGQIDGTFATHQNAYNNFSYEIGNWRVDKHVRKVADVNNDGRVDIVGFGNSDVYIAYGQTDGTFDKHYVALEDKFVFNTGWDITKHVREVADVNGDGRADIIGFHQSSVYVALATVEN